MKKTVLFLLTILMAGMSKAQTTVAPDATGMEQTAPEWAKQVVMGWNLGNSLESERNETAWGNPKTTKAMIQYVHEAGFNGIRIPVRWMDHVIDQSTMAVDPTWMARVKEIVDWALEENMYVIINSHHEAWYDRNPYYDKQEENNQKLGALWTNIATEFRDYDSRLLFAGTNEITVNWGAPTTEQQAVQNSYNQTFIDAVRATGGKNYYRNLVVQTFACSPYHGLNGFTIPNDPVEGHLCVEFHYYDPYDYCGSCKYYYWGNAYKDKGPIITNSTEQTITQLFNRIQNTWGSKGLGIVIGEYGVSCHYTNDDKDTQMENMQYYLTCLVSEARKHGFAAFAWDNNVFGNGEEKFGIFRRTSSGMSVGNTYFLRGITEGAGAEYVEPVTPGPEDNPDGVTFWEGDEMLNWDKGLQLYIPASEFQGKTTDLQVVLYYTQDYDDYCMFQLNQADWQGEVTFTAGGIVYQANFIPNEVYGTGTGTDHVTACSFSAEQLAILQQKGLVIQGHGMRLTKVTLAMPTAINEINVSPAGDNRIFLLDGRQVQQPQPRQLYIKNGKKYIHQND